MFSKTADTCRDVEYDLLHVFSMRNMLAVQPELKASCIPLCTKVIWKRSQKSQDCCFSVCFNHWQAIFIPTAEIFRWGRHSRETLTFTQVLRCTYSHILITQSHFKFKQLLDYLVWCQNLTILPSFRFPIKDTYVKCALHRELDSIKVMLSLFCVLMNSLRCHFLWQIPKYLNEVSVATCLINSHFLDFTHWKFPLGCHVERNLLRDTEYEWSLFNSIVENIKEGI
jgi:hypothetical protein